MPLPISKLCCCDGCFEFIEYFVREDDDVELLAPDWEPCVDWTDWQITALGVDNGVLENLEPNAILILKHMVGPPYGILKGHIQDTVGAIYRIHVYYGDELDPCSGPHHYVEIEYDALAHGYIRIKTGSTTLIDAEFTARGDTDFTVCVGDKIIEAKVDESETIRYCTDIGGYWFALEGVTHPSNGGGEQVTQWSYIRYIDHWEHDKTCPRCSSHCCFEEYNQVIAGFTIIIHDIAPGDCETCAMTFELDALVDAVPGQHKCDCELVFRSEELPGPHTCPFGLNTSEGVVTFFCNVDLEKTIWWSFSLVINGATEVQWGPLTFPGGTAPYAVFSDYLEVFDPGDGSTCNYENSWLEFVPILVEGCCSEPPPEELRVLGTATDISPPTKPVNVKVFHDLWNELHSYAPANKDNWNVTKAKEFYRAWKHKIPKTKCPCNNHWILLCASAPPNFTTPEKFFEWTYARHDDVSSTYSKAPRISLLEAYRLYWP